MRGGKGREQDSSAFRAMLQDRDEVTAKKKRRSDWDVCDVDLLVGRIWESRYRMKNYSQNHHEVLDAINREIVLKRPTMRGR